MPIEIIPPSIKTKALAILLKYNSIQRNGATDDGTLSPLQDNLVVGNDKAQTFAQSKTPLFTPFDKYDPELSDAARAAAQISDEGAVYRQLGDNGLAPTFFSIVLGLAPELTSSKWVVGTRSLYAVASPADTDTTFQISGTLPHSTKHESAGYPTAPGSTAGESGVPVNPDTDLLARYVELISGTTGQPLVASDGQRVYGVAQVGASTPGTSVEIALKKRPHSQNPNVAGTTYAWEAAFQGAITLNVFYPFRQAMSELDDVAFRRVFR